jgi:hypothetical protein
MRWRPPHETLALRLVDRRRPHPLCAGLVVPDLARNARISRNYGGYTMTDARNVREGEWDFDGSCAPKEGSTKGYFTGQMTFTLGCFQWVRRGKDGQGSGLKKGKVQYRVKGHVSETDEAYRKAREYCAKKNAQIEKQQSIEAASND